MIMGNPQSAFFADMIDLKKVVGTEQHSYSDYEELAFTTVWNKWRVELERQIMLNCPDESDDFRDTIFYTAVHVCAEQHELTRKVTNTQIAMVVGALTHQLILLRDCTHISRARINWAKVEETSP
jgi:hypothetical protein